MVEYLGNENELGINSFGVDGYLLPFGKDVDGYLLISKDWVDRFRSRWVGVNSRHCMIKSEGLESSVGVDIRFRVAID